jgi:endoglucanase
MTRSGRRPVLIMTGLAVATALALTGAATACASAQPKAGPVRAATDAAPSLHVSGNRLVNADGARIILRGVNRSGGETQCVHDRGIWSGPMNQASVTAMKKWHINAVRIPLNEACWNGQPYVNFKYRGARYRNAVEAYVSLLNHNGLVAILDLHWTDGEYRGHTAGCPSARAVCQKPMPDSAQSIPFWRSVAEAFKSNDSVIFDLFNEPYPQNQPGATQAEGWHCLLYGGRCAGIAYPVAGMQTLVNTVRATGARNVIMLGGLAYSNNLSQWLAYEPKDPDHNLVASWHSYNFNPCITASCWNSQLAPVIAQVPVIAGEIGENDCADRYIDGLMTWLDARSTGYLAWAWNANFGCGSGPSLITSYAGTPTAYGRGFRSHLLSLR